MFDLGALDIIISIVVVLLVLSLIVQSIQSLLKKLLKLKSTVVFGSMEDLFKFIDTNALVNTPPKQLVTEVTNQFKELGRVSSIRKKPMMDSISKEDLQKILTKLHGDALKAEVEKWFDTVMQSFEERYTRHMKTVALVVSFGVVVFLNANFFNIYRNIADSDIRRAELLQKGQALLDRRKALENAAGGNAEKPTPSPATSPAAGATPPATGSAAAAASPTPPKTAPADANQPNQSDQQIKEELKKNAQETQQYINEYKGLGFTPLRRQQINDFLMSEGYWADKTPQDKFVHAIRVLLGWTIMALLLSVGAPFWQDTLESLFGIKGLIRQKGKTENVAQRSGEGQTKP